MVTKSIDYTSNGVAGIGTRFNTMRSNSEVLAQLIHATSLDKLFLIRVYTWPLYTMSKNLEHFMSTQVAYKVTEINLSK